MPTGSIKLKAGTVAPSMMLKKLSGYKQQNRLHLALQEIGRIERTLFTMDWLESPELRRRLPGRPQQGRGQAFRGLSSNGTELLGKDTTCSGLQSSGSAHIK